MDKTTIIPEGLSPKGKAAAKAILELAKAHFPNFSTDGCRAFYTPKDFFTPEECERKGKKRMAESSLVVVHDGGDLPYFFNIDNMCVQSYEAMIHKLSRVGCWFENFTPWYTVVYER